MTHIAKSYQFSLHCCYYWPCFSIYYGFHTFFILWLFPQQNLLNFFFFYLKRMKFLKILETSILLQKYMSIVVMKLSKSTREKDWTLILVLACFWWKHKKHITHPRLGCRKIQPRLALVHELASLTYTFPWYNELWQDICLRLQLHFFNDLKMIKKRLHDKIDFNCICVNNSSY